MRFTLPMPATPKRATNKFQAITPENPANGIQGEDAQRAAGNCRPLSFQSAMTKSGNRFLSINRTTTMIWSVMRFNGMSSRRG